MSIRIRRLSADDADLADLAAQFNAADSEVSRKAFTEGSLRDFLSSPDRHYVVAYRGEELAGMVHGYVMHHPSGVTYYYVDEVDTIVGHRRHGIATALMEELFRIAAEVGADELWLGTEHDNDGAKALYEGLKPSEVDHGPIYTYKVIKYHREHS